MHKCATTSSSPGQTDSAELVPFGRGVVQMLATAVAFGLLSKVAEFFSESCGVLLHNVGKIGHGAGQVS